MQIPEISITEKIPITLLQPYLNNGHILFTDNFYTTPLFAPKWHSPCRYCEAKSEKFSQAIGHYVSRERIS